MAGVEPKWHAVLPPLSLYAFTGDVDGVMARLIEGDDIHESVPLVNGAGQSVLGCTPLYLAAQAGHTDVCRVLLVAGADVTQQCVLPATNERFGAEDIALVHLHLRTWWLLRDARQRCAPKRAVAGSGAGALALPLLL
ncbi:MAG: hypothetical protein J3K34DRAFT_516306 [Monoraphidium minutum]|nr:MAG: hypothetical protein J3K34DRAFT_516306 [Monoraphidium minutum]